MKNRPEQGEFDSSGASGTSALAESGPLVPVLGNIANDTCTYVEPVTGALVDAGTSTNFTNAAYDDALYHPGQMARSARNLDSVSDDDVRFYSENGYLSVEQAFSPSEIDAAMQGLIDLVMGKNPAFKQVTFEAKARKVLPGLTPEQRLDYVRKLDEFVEFDSRLKALAHHPKLLAVARRMVGDDAVLFSDMAMIKPPKVGREKPWHQDMAYYKFEPETKVVGVWVALDEATVENGCMQLLPDLKKRGAIIHFKRRDWQICDAEIMGRRSVAAPLKPGGLLFFDGLLPHGTPENRSQQRRRAVQFHYVSASAKKVTDEDRLRVFGNEGKNVTC